MQWTKALFLCCVQNPQSWWISNTFSRSSERWAFEWWSESNWRMVRTHSFSANESNAMITNYIVSYNKIQASISFRLHQQNSIHLFYKAFSIHHLRKNTFQFNFAKVKLFIQKCMLCIVQTHTLTQPRSIKLSTIVLISAQTIILLFQILAGCSSWILPRVWSRR